MMKKISFPLALGLASLGTFSGQKLLCQEEENTAEQGAAQEAEPRPGWSPGTQRQAANSQCCLAGWWQNELGSKMQIGCLEDGNFSGKYYTAVSSTQKPIEPAPLYGSQNNAGAGQPTFGFTVNWETFSDSTTVFTGQCFTDGDGKEILQTMWLLREMAEDAKDNWESTRVGTNIFTRVK